MLVECNECGKELITEADTYTIIPTKRDGENINCGCMYYPKGELRDKSSLTLYFPTKEERDSFHNQINKFEKGDYYEIKNASVVACQKDLDERFNVLCLSLSTAKDLMDILDLSHLPEKDEVSVRNWIEGFSVLDQKTGIMATVEYLKYLKRDRNPSSS